MAETYTTVFGIIVTAAAPYGIAVQGQVYEAADPLAFAPTTGDTVLADWLPSAGQYVIVGVVP